MGLTRHSSSPDIEYDELFNPLHLLEVALDEEGEVLDFLKRQPSKYWPEDANKFILKRRRSATDPSSAIYSVFLKTD